MLWEAEAHVSGAVEDGDQEGKTLRKESTEILMCSELAEEEAFSTQDAQWEIRDESDSLQCEMERCEMERGKQELQYGEGALATVTNVVSCAKEATEEGMSAISSVTGKFAKARGARFIKLERQVPSFEVAIRRRLSNSAAFRFLQELGIEWAFHVLILLVGGHIRWSPSQSLYTRGVKVLLCLSLFGIFAVLHQVRTKTLETNRLGNPLPLSSAYEGAPIELNIYGADIYG